MNARSGPEPQVIYEFGDFRLDVSRQQLFPKGGSTPISIKPKVFDALLYFVEHPDRLLEKERLMAELWPGLVVEENGLSQVISALRHALGEAPGDNRYLVTVHGRGYRFVANVVRLPDPADAPPATTDDSRTRINPSANDPARIATSGESTARLAPRAIAFATRGAPATAAGRITKNPAR